MYSQLFTRLHMEFAYQIIVTTHKHLIIAKYTKRATINCDKSQTGCDDIFES